MHTSDTLYIISPWIHYQIRQKSKVESDLIKYWTDCVLIFRTPYLYGYGVLYILIFSSSNSNSCQGSQVFEFIIIILLQYGFVPSRHDLCQFSCPGFRNPVFCSVVWFFKKFIFGIYMLWGGSWCKNFPGQILSGIRFCPKSIIFRHFS